MGPSSPFVEKNSQGAGVHSLIQWTKGDPRILASCRGREEPPELVRNHCLQAIYEPLSNSFNGAAHPLD